MENQKRQRRFSVLWIGMCLLALAFIYVFQRFDYTSFVAGLFGIKEVYPNVVFIVNRTLRLIANDALCFLLIFFLFEERKYLRVAFLVFCFELFLMLPLYLIVKLSVEGNSEISSPLLSQIHRLIVNPMLMLLLMVAFYYQRFWGKEKKNS
jgi:exosortase F-associated protein